LLLLLLLVLVVMMLVLLLLFLLGFVLGQADVLLPGSLLQLQMLLATARKGAAAAVGPGDCGAVGVVAVGVWLPPAHPPDQEQGQGEGPAVATG
jgi:hypothetical protein